MEKVTVVLPIRNGQKNLEKRLARLRADACPANLIVVDDGSTDGTARAARRAWPGATVLTLPAHTGFAHAANVGLHLVRTPYAFLLGQDIRPGRDCMGSLLDCLEEAGPGICCAVPRLRGENAAAKSPAGLPDGHGRKSAPAGSPDGHGRKSAPAGTPDGRRRKSAPAGMPGGRRRENLPQARETLAVPDGCAMYRMAALEEIGWLDERQFEGLLAFDLALRAAARGYKSLLAPGAHAQLLPRAGDSQARTSHGGPDTPAQAPSASRLFRTQVAVGNLEYALYKNLPALPRVLCLSQIRTARDRLRAALEEAGREDAGRAGRQGRFEDTPARRAFDMAQSRGDALVEMEKARRRYAASGAGIGLYAETLAEASCLGMDRNAGKIYPLFLAEKWPASPLLIPRYLHLVRLLRQDSPRIPSLCGICHAQPTRVWKSRQSPVHALQEGVNRNDQ